MPGDDLFDVISAVIREIPMRKMITAALLVFGVGHQAQATDPVDFGTVSELTYRNGYYVFRLNNSSGNSCQPCPLDPATVGYNKCWIHESKTVQIALLLSAHAQGLRVTGRVNDIATDCTVYQMRVEDPA